MKLLTYNMRQGGSAAHWEALLSEFAPDLVFAQESNDPAGFESLLTALFHDRLLWRSARPGRWGSALLLPSSVYRPLVVPDHMGWVTGAEMENMPWGDMGVPLRVFSVHVPSGRGSYVRETHRILDQIQAIPGRADFILGGDFNLTVGKPTGAGDRPTKRAEVALHARLEKEFSLVSAWSAGNQGLLMPQTLRWSGDPSTPYHCDGIFIPSHWVEWLTRASVIGDPKWVERSDHNPVLLEFGAVQTRGGDSS